MQLFDKCSVQKMNSFLLFVLFFGLTKCVDWCSLIAPDGRSHELGITRKWKSTGEGGVEFIMYNRAGKEWLFTFTAENIHSPKSIQIKIDEKSVRKGSDSDVIHRFGIYSEGKIKTGRHDIRWEWKTFTADIRLIKTVCLRIQSLI